MAQEVGEIPDAATLEAGFKAARNAWNREYADARQRADEEQQAALRKARPQAVFVPRFAAGAEAHAGTERAVPYLSWLVRHAPAARSQQAMTSLMERHAASPGIRLAVARIGGLKRDYGIDRSRAWLDRVLAENGDRHVQAQARYTRAAMYVGTRAVARSDELRALAVADLKAALELLGEARESTSLRGLATRLLDEAQRLEPGHVAPEIAGEDLDGVPFKLSDYRGKVVLLDFWGDW